MPRSASTGRKLKRKLRKLARKATDYKVIHKGAVHLLAAKGGLTSEEEQQIKTSMEEIDEGKYKDFSSADDLVNFIKNE